MAGEAQHTCHMQGHSMEPRQSLPCYHTSVIGLLHQADH